MSKLNDLIKELCPNGVEKISLGSLMKRVKEKNYDNSNISTVYSVTKESGIVKSDDLHDFSVYSDDLSNYYILRKNQYAYNPARLNIGSIARLKNNEPGLVSPMYVVFELNDSKINHNYFEHLLFSKKMFNDMCSFVEQGARFRFDYKNWNRIYIALPPIEIQEEIVRILDKFGELEVELEAELEVRKSQYEYWSSKIFSKNNITKIENICKNVTSGGTPNTSCEEYYNGSVPWLRTQEVNWNLIEDTEIKITEAAIKKSSAKLIPSNCVIVAMYGATVGKVAINKIPLSTNQACCNLEIDGNIANYKYVFYWLSHQYKYIKSLGQGSQTNINAQIVKKLIIPISSLEEQERIVNILDKFDKLINDISEGLPAEINLRRKQYEYYRNKLLSFEELITND